MLSWLFPFPPNYSAWGGQIDDLFWMVVWLTLVAFLAVMGSLFYFLIAYRERPGHRAYYTHGDQKPHLLLTTFLSVLVFITMDFQIERNSRRYFEFLLHSYPTSEDTVKVQVRGEQFKWYFRYAGRDGEFGTRDDILDVHLTLPAGRPVVLAITSKDVIHSLFFPHLRVKQDAVPGYVTTMWFKINPEALGSSFDPENKRVRKGTWEIACAELCGNSHTTMRAQLKVLEGQAFDRWLQKAMVEDANPDNDEDQSENWGWAWSSTPFGGHEPEAWAKENVPGKVEVSH